MKVMSGSALNRVRIGTFPRCATVVVSALALMAIHAGVTHDIASAETCFPKGKFDGKPGPREGEHAVCKNMVITNNLHNADLSWAELNGSTFKDVDLSGAQLVKADMTGVTFENVNLSGANMTGATLINASLDDKTTFGKERDHANVSGTGLVPNLTGFSGVGADGVTLDDVRKRAPLKISGASLDLCMWRIERWDNWHLEELPSLSSLSEAPAP
jgi:hypothetical protein